MWAKANPTFLVVRLSSVLPKLVWTVCVSLCLSVRKESTRIARKWSELIQYTSMSVIIILAILWCFLTSLLIWHKISLPLFFHMPLKLSAIWWIFHIIIIHVCVCVCDINNYPCSSLPKLSPSISLSVSFTLKLICRISWYRGTLKEFSLWRNETCACVCVECHPNDVWCTETQANGVCMQTGESKSN